MGAFGETLLGIIQSINALGAMTIMPLIITIMGIVFGIGWGKSVRSGITVGIGFMGVNLILGAFFGIAPVAAQMVERFGFELTVIDAGWGVASTMAWGYGFIVPVVVVAVIILNVVMIWLNLTKTLMIDIWNFWHFLIAASAAYFITGSLFVAVGASLVVAAAMFILADKTAHILEEEMGMPGVSFPHGSTVPWALPAFYINKLLDKTPLKNIKADPDSIQESLGALGEPGVLGCIIGALIGVLAGQTVPEIMTTAITTGGIMLIFPRMVGLLVEGLMPISEGAREFLQRHMQGREIYLGLDGIILFGHPSVMAVSLLMIPITLVLAAILPGNRVLPLADLVGLPIVAWSVATSRFNVAKGLVTSIICAVFMLYIATDVAPIVTHMAAELNYALPQGANEISALVVGGQLVNWVVIKVLSLVSWGL
jgi:PTS system galactitol-specific IIC component